MTPKGVMHLNLNEMRSEIELIFEKYRKHKYYTLFKTDINLNVTSKIDEIGGGRSNKISDSTGNEAIKIADEKQEAIEYVKRVEKAVDQLPDIEKEIIKHRYMSRNHNYINDYTIYELKIPMSKPTYIKLRERAFKSLYKMLV